MEEQNKPNDYELVSKSELEYLRKEVEKLKKNPLGDSHSNKTLLESMDQLSLSTNKMINILETANDDIVRDYKEHSTSQRMDKIIEQNEKLAKGMIIIADLLKEIKGYKQEQAALKNDFKELENRMKKTPAPAPRPSPARFSGNSSFGMQTNNNKDSLIDDPSLRNYDEERPGYDKPKGPKVNDDYEEERPGAINPLDVPPPPR